MKAWTLQGITLAGLQVPIQAHILGYKTKTNIYLIMVKGKEILDSAFVFICYWQILGNACIGAKNPLLCFWCKGIGSLVPWDGWSTCSLVLLPPQYIWLEHTSYWDAPPKTVNLVNLLHMCLNIEWTHWPTRNKYLFLLAYKVASIYIGPHTGVTFWWILMKWQWMERPWGVCDMVYVSVVSIALGVGVSLNINVFYEFCHYVHVCDNT